ncbi:leucine-rich repeat domain-containing protein, partial [Enterorhabdus sp. P55]|uniref:leucine-rich repeat domain-containing protein n=1 Tax=Enterorhabdus sp. P55 TaxID=2304571 RepID=UPI001F264F39
GSMAVNEWVGCFVGPDGKWVPGYQGPSDPSQPGDANAPSTPGDTNDPTLPSEPANWDLSREIDGKTDDGFVYSGTEYLKDGAVVSGYIVIEAYQGSKQDIAVPNSINGLPVTAVTLSTSANLNEIVPSKTRSSSLTSVDFTSCQSVTKIALKMQELENLRLEDHPALESLTIDQSGISTTIQGKLRSLDLSDCPNLTALTIYHSKIAAIDLSACKKLETVTFYRNNFVDLSFSGLSSLKKISCQQNSALTALNLSGCTSLVELQCDYNKIKALDTSSCKALEELNCSWNEISSLSVHGCNKLQIINFYANQLTTFDPSGLPALKVIKYNSYYPGHGFDASAIEAWGVYREHCEWVRKDLV